MSMEEKKTDDIVLDRSCIGCDRCRVGSPQKCCSRCRSVYYCSKECQVQHWKEHKEMCTDLKERWDKWTKDSNNVLPDNNKVEAKEGPCAICLEEIIMNPIVLPCGHVFCFECVGSYQFSENSEDPCSCPYCRGEIPNVIETAGERARLYQERVYASTKRSEDQKKYAKLAIKEYGAILDATPRSETEAYMHGLYTVLSIMALSGQPNKTIEMAKDLLLLNDENPGLLGDKDIVYVKYFQAEAYTECGLWNEAGPMYRSSYEEYSKLGVVPIKIITGLSRAMYEVHEFDDAIKFGSMGTDRYRVSAGVHKYLALAYKAKGDIDEAKKVMTMAILYERHWDRDNREQNMEILRELNNL